VNHEALRMRDQIAANYLQQLQALAGEIAVSTDAIAANALPAFQESIAKQEMLCSSLASMSNAVREGFRSPDHPLHSSTASALELKIRAATGELQQLNMQYAALLKHSGKSIALLISLCKSHTGQFPEAREPRPKHQTWSCEM
jgi:hypothetical protein